MICISTETARHSSAGLNGQKESALHHHKSTYIRSRFMENKSKKGIQWSSFFGLPSYRVGGGNGDAIISLSRLEGCPGEQHEGTGDV